MNNFESSKNDWLVNATLKKKSRPVSAPRPSEDKKLPSVKEQTRSSQRKITRCPREWSPSVKKPNQKPSAQIDSISSTSINLPTRKRCEEILAGNNFDVNPWECPICKERGQRAHWLADHVLKYLLRREDACGR